MSRKSKDKNQICVIVEHACVDAGVTKAELARRLGMTPQAFYQRLITGKFTYNELASIANVLGGVLCLKIEFVSSSTIEN